MRFVKYIIVCAFCIVVGITYSRETPQLKKWILIKIQVLSREKASLEVTAKKIKFNLLPPGIELIDLTLTPKDKPLSQTVAPVQIERLRITLSPLALITGRFEIGSILIEHPVVSLFIKKPERQAGKKETSFEIPWDDLIHLPIKNIYIQGADILTDLEGPGILLKLDGFGLNFQKTPDSLQLEIFSPHTLIKQKGIDSSLTELGLATRIIAEKEVVEVSALKLSIGKNFVIGRGQARGEITKLKYENLGVRTISHLNLDEIADKLRIFFPTLKLPRMAGQFNFEAVGSQKRGNIPVASAEIDTQNLEVNQFKIGNVHTKVSVVKDVLTTPALEINTTAGHMILKDLTVSFAGDSKFSARVLTEDIVLEKLLENIGSGHPPIHMDISLKTACEGIYAPQYRVECAGEAAGRNFDVHSEPEKHTIAAVKDFKIVTRFILENGKMNFPEGELSMGGSRGKASGQIDFVSGFNINYSSPALDFKDITSLADLKYVGAIEIAGSTSGDGHAATFKSHIKMNDFWFQDYGFGKGEFDLRYEKSDLYFSNLSAHFSNTDYQGDVTVKLSSPSTINANLNFSRLNLEDITYAFSKKVTLPFSASAQGSALIHASGPMALSKLNYTLRSQFDNGIVFGEAIRDLVFNVHGINGHAYADDVRLKKGDGKVHLKGDVSNNGIMSLFVKGEDIRLADFDHLRTSFKGLDGLLGIDMALQDRILDPRMSLRGLVTNITINQDPLEDSNFSLDVVPDKFIFNAGFFAEQVKVSLTQPRQQKAPFSFKLEANNWDFSQVLSLVSGSDFKKDYETNVTANVDLSSSSGNFWDSIGRISVPRFFVRHGNSQMENKDPLEIKFNGGNVDIQNFNLQGDNTNIKATGSRDKKDNLKVNVDGNLDLSLLTFLTPFFQDMRGILKINSQVAGHSSKPEFLGNAFIDKGYFKLRTFVHPFEDIKADVLFSQSRIVVNSIKGALAGGDMALAGNVVIKGYHDIPVDISGDLNHATFTVPDGLMTKGSGRFRISGSWFPYTLHADYNVDSGLYSKNFGDENNSTLIKRSAFLPKTILQKEAAALEFDLNTHFQKGISVKNNIVDSDVKGDIRVRGDPGKILLTGEIETQPNGKIFFRETPFAISTARVKFDNPNENNPVIYAEGTSRVREWDVNLLFQGTMDKHEIKLSSSPPLPERSIVSLLALGTTEDDLEKSRSTDQQALQGYQAGGVLLEQNPLVQDFKRSTGVQVRFTQNVDDTRNIIMPRFVAQKDWTPKFSTSLGRTLGDRSASDFKMEYRFNKSISILGSYEQRDYDQFSVSTLPNSATIPVPVGTQPTSTTDIMGIDLQYQLEFR